MITHSPMSMPATTRRSWCATMAQLNRSKPPACRSACLMLQVGNHGQSPLLAGDRLLVFTDGIPEAINAAEDFYSDERLEKFAVDHRTEPPDAFATALIADVSQFRRRRPPQRRYYADAVATGTVVSPL